MAAECHMWGELGLGGHGNSHQRTQVLLWSCACHALKEEQGLVSLHRACCHHKLCSVLHKGCGENVVWGLLLGFSSVGEVWDAW